MTITIELPPDLDQASIHRLQREAREAVAAGLYRRQKLPHGQLGKFLGIGPGQVDEVLARRGAFDEFTADETAERAHSLQRLRNQPAAEMHALPAHPPPP